MSEDVSHILNSWEYNPEKIVRILIKADDGRDVLQVRQPLGIEQCELDGRPDGSQPYGAGCYVDYTQKAHIVVIETETIRMFFLLERTKRGKVIVKGWKGSVRL